MPLPVLYVRHIFDCFYLLSKKCLDFQLAYVCVSMLFTTHLILLNQFGQHDNDGCMVFPHHLPEVIQCVWGGALGRGRQERTVCTPDCVYAALYATYTPCVAM